ncbi:hypothetical protein BDZ45DRAFT_742587 [Acephala macrosclerotiorum]|nr:hypothetical protein BDZ45DRAFT_742587 [Acephala macrosclerotiorum]
MSPSGTEEQELSSPIIEAEQIEGTVPNDEKRKFPWEQLPFETREKIFKDVGNDYASLRWVFTSPLPSLSELARLHTHMLQWFRKQNGSSFAIKMMDYPFKGMNTEEIKLVESLKIVSPNWRWRKRRTSAMLSFAPMEDFATEVKEASNIIHLITEFPFWLRGFKTLQSLTVEIPYIEIVVFDGKLQEELLQALIRRIQNITGVKGRLEKDAGSIGLNLEWTYIWDAIQDEARIYSWGGLWKERNPRGVLGKAHVWTWEAAAGQDPVGEVEGWKERKELGHIPSDSESSNAEEEESEKEDEEE